MRTVEIETFQINDIVRTLEYAKIKKMEDYKKGKMNISQYNFELGIIKDLIALFPIKTYTGKNKIDKDLIEKEETIQLL